MREILDYSCKKCGLPGQVVFDLCGDPGLDAFLRELAKLTLTHDYCLPPDPQPIKPHQKVLPLHPEPRTPHND